MSSSDEEPFCPICTEELDITDIHFKPCSCGYQLCRFCWNNIMALNGKCPACRKPYDPENYTFIPLDKQEIAKQKSKRKKEKKKPNTEKETPNLKNLSNIRVIQRNLVYITNLALSIAKEEKLRQYEYFGQYGKIGKIVINKNNLYSVNSPYGPSVSAYITFVSKKDALACINAIDGFWLENRALRASFGTTKYCTYFLRNLPCNNPDCMYLHELGGENDSFTKEEIANGKHNFHETNDTEPELTEEELLALSNGRETVLPQRLTLPEIPYESEEDEGEPEKGNQDTSSDEIPTPATVEKENIPQKKMTVSQKQSVWKTSNAPPPDAPVNDDEFPSTDSLASSEKSLLPPTASWGRASKNKETTQSSGAIPTDKKLEGSVWGAPPGLRSSKNNDPSESHSLSHSSKENTSEKTGNLLSEDSFPDLREVYKPVPDSDPKNQPKEDSRPNTTSQKAQTPLSQSEKHIPIPPSLDDRPPGLAASQEAAQNQSTSHFTNPSTKWWEQPSPSQNTPASSSWNSGASWGLPSGSFFQGGSHHTEKSSLFDDWPDLSGILEEKETEPEQGNRNANSVPHHAEKIPSSSIFGHPKHSPPTSQFPSFHEEDEREPQDPQRTPSPEENQTTHNDPHQVFRSLFPNVNVNFRPSPGPSNTQRPNQATAAPPGLVQGREKWNPMMGPGFNSPWQLFGQDSPSQPPNSFWGVPNPSTRSTIPSGGYNNNNTNPMRQDRPHGEPSSWNNIPPRQEEQSHPFSLLSHLNQSQSQRQQQQRSSGDYNPSQNTSNPAGDPRQSQYGMRQNHGPPGLMGTHFNPFQQGEHSINAHTNTPGWLNSGPPRSNGGQQGGVFPPGLSDPNKSQEIPNGSHYNARPMQQFHRPPDHTQQQQQQPNMGRPMGMNVPPGFVNNGTGPHMGYYFHQTQGRNVIQNQEAEGKPPANWQTL